MELQNKTSCRHPVIPIVLVTALVFLGVYLLLSTSWNERIFLCLNHSLCEMTGPSFWGMLTNFGDGFFLFPLAMLLVWRNPERQLALLCSVIFTVIVLKLAKGLIAFERPVALLGESVPRIVGPVLKHNSLPSGHTGTVFLLAGLSLFWLRGKIVPVILVLAGMVAVSRIAVGAHWPADILLGAWVGLVCSAVGIRISQCFRPGLSWRISYLLLGLIIVIVLPNYSNGFREVSGVLLCQQCLAVTALVAMISEIIVIGRGDDQHHGVDERYAG